ncbi:hypothetical protein ACKWTF_012395 [Chironomus riparius]
MYASYNKFNHNIYRDANVVTTIDTFTSIISGCISFAIIGHLKHALKVDDITKVIKGGPGLVFVTYPETIAKFKFVPQVSLGYAVFGTLCGSLYITPGGSAVIDLGDHYTANFIAFILAFFEIISFCYIYGVKRICMDVDLMIGHAPSLYWKVFLLTLL